MQSVAREEYGYFRNTDYHNTDTEAREKTFGCNRKTLAWCGDSEPAQLSTHDQRVDEREKRGQWQQAERDKQRQRGERKNWEKDERIEQRNHDCGGVSEAGERKTVWIVAANRKPNLELSERH